MAKKIDDLSDKNAAALVELLLDQDTPDNTQFNIISHLVNSRKGQGFHKTIFEEMLSFGKCPKCNHENHWIIPEDDLNKMGWVTSQEDPKVPVETNIENCTHFQQACKKKKVMV